MAIVGCDPQHDTVGPAETYLDGVFATRPRGINIEKGELFKDLGSDKLDWKYDIAGDATYIPSIADAVTKIQLRGRQLGKHALNGSSCSVPTNCMKNNK